MNQGIAINQKSDRNELTKFGADETNLRFTGCVDWEIWLLWNNFGHSFMLFLVYFYFFSFGAHSKFFRFQCQINYKNWEGIVCLKFVSGFRINFVLSKFGHSLFNLALLNSLNLPYLSTSRSALIIQSLKRKMKKKNL